MSSRFTALKQRRVPENKEEAKPINTARRGNPVYKQFSAYIPSDLYRRLKIRLAETGADLSEAAEEAIDRWLALP